MRAFLIAAVGFAGVLGCGGGGSTFQGSSDSGGADHTAPGSDGGRKLDGGASDGSSSDGSKDGGSLDGNAGDSSDGGSMPTEWTIVSTPLDGGTNLYGVGGYTVLDVWAVGGTATGPADIFWSGTSWTDLGLVTSTSPLLSVSSQLPSDSWSVAGSTLFHWDGTGWHTLAGNTNTMPLTSVWAYEDGSTYAVGNAGTILNCASATASCTSTSVGTSDLTGVFAIDADLAWAVGKGGVVYSYAGTSWTAESSAVTSDLHAVGGSQLNDVWAVGEAIEHGPGSWSKDPFTPPGTLYGVVAYSKTQAWAVGKGGIILAWDGKHWKSTTSPTTSDLYAIWGATVHDIWAVGANNTVLNRKL
jgi:hypothetical protein